MNSISRREFLRMAAALAASMGWPTTALARIAEGLESLAAGRAPVVWLHGQACSGCSVSFLNTTYPDAARVLTQYISLAYHTVVSAATGDTALQVLDRRMAAGDYVLVVEGAVPQGMPRACLTGGREFVDLLTRAARGATSVVAVGTCAAFGGIPAAPPNPTGAMSVSRVLSDAGVSTPLINLPGCPAHPDWLVGTLVHLMKFGQPALNAQGCPQLFYGSVIHTRCPRFYSYEMGHFARFFGDDGCLFKLGCLGIRTHADCPTRHWNSKVNWCVGAGAPCIGCARPEFAHQREFPFYRIREQSEQGK